MLKENKNNKHYFSVSGFQFEYRSTNLKDAKNVFERYARNDGYLELKEVVENEVGYYSKSIKIKY